MRIFNCILFLLFLSLFNTAIAQQSGITTVIIVRHAEKDTISTDPPLTLAGEQRAAKLAAMLDKSGVSAVFSTNTTRTIETVNNYAYENDLEIILYDDYFKLADLIKSEYRGKKVLVSAHANTIGPLMFALGAGSVIKIDHNYYGGLFVLTLCPDGKVSVLQLEY